MNSITASRNRLTLIIIGISLLITGSLAAWMVYQRTKSSIALTPPDESFSKLSTLIPGETLTVPGTQGIWILKQKQVNIIANLGTQLGNTEIIDLCTQRNAGKPLTPYLPLNIGGDYADLKNRLAEGTSVTRNHVIVPSNMKSGMPSLNLSWSKDPNAEKSRSFLQAVGEFNEAGGWQLLSDLGAAQTTQNGIKIEMEKQAWLVWRGAVSKEKNANFARYDYAIRVQRGTISSCPVPGAPHAHNIELSLFTTDGKSATNATLNQHVPLTIFPQVGETLTTRMDAGTYAIEKKRPFSVEDKSLFDAALAKGFIRLGASGQIELAPIDLPAAIEGKDMALAGDWKSIRSFDREAKHLFKRLYTKADGAYVRTQITRYNQDRLWSAVRIKPIDSATKMELNDRKLWSATVDGVSMPLTVGLPDVSARLFSDPPEGWSEWIRIGAWPKNAGATSMVRMTVSLHKTTPSFEKGLQIMSLGPIISIRGAKLLTSEAICTAHACKASNMLVKSTLIPDVPRSKIEISLLPEPHFNELNPGTSEFRHIRVVKGSLTWVQPPANTDVPLTKAEVTVLARDGSMLFSNGKPTDDAKKMGLETLVGIADNHGSSVSGMLSRIGATAESKQQVAMLTIDPVLQKIANQVLNCIGLQGKTWLADKETCSEALHESTKRDGRKIVSPMVVGRHAGLIIVDSAKGDILASAGLPLPSEEASTQELIAFDRFNPGKSALRLRATQHDASLETTPGSSYKLVTALGLEQAAQQSKEIESQLNGMSIDATNQLAAKNGYAFSMSGSCYPLPCNGKQVNLDNFDNERPIDRIKKSQTAGLSLALSESFNTWFAYLAEQSDATLALSKKGNPDIRPLGGNLLDSARPVAAIAHELGFDRSVQLDGGLLPRNFKWQSWDALLASPSRLDPIEDRHQVRLQAIGHRMQVTPLQMALVAGSIGEGQSITPKLLLKLNEQHAETPSTTKLNVRLDRIQAGMKAVVVDGTAKSAFISGPLLKMRTGVFAKTGTAAFGNEQSKKHNTSWFVGYIEPNTMPHQPNRLAFAVFISKSQQTGGAHAAPVIASIMHTLALRNNSIRPK